MSSSHGSHSSAGPGPQVPPPPHLSDPTSEVIAKRSLCELTCFELSDIKQEFASLITPAWLQRESKHTARLETEG